MSHWFTDPAAGWSILIWRDQHTHDPSRHRWSVLHPHAIIRSWIIVWVLYYWLELSYWVSHCKAPQNQCGLRLKLLPQSSRRAGSKVPAAEGRWWCRRWRSSWGCSKPSVSFPHAITSGAAYCSVFRSLLWLTDHYSRNNRLIVINPVIDWWPDQSLIDTVLNHDWYL